MNRPSVYSAEEWASFIEQPDAHLGPADRGLIAAILRQQAAAIKDYQNRSRSLRAAHSQLERTLTDALERLGEKL